MIYLYHFASTSPFHLKRAGLFARGALREEGIEWVTSLDGVRDGYLIGGSLPHPDMDAVFQDLGRTALPHQKVFLVGQVRTGDELSRLKESLSEERLGGFIEFGTGVGGASAHLCPCLAERVTALNETGHGWTLDSVESARLFIRAVAGA